MKTYVNRFPVNGPWGGGNLFVKAFHELAPKMPGIEIIPPGDMKTTPNVILLAGLDNDGAGISADQAVMYKSMMEGNCDVKIVLRVNENDARKGTHHMDNLLVKISQYVDSTVFVSNWLRDYFLVKGWACEQNTVIYNGVDTEIFKPGEKLNNGKINILAHHWSDNAMKGADIYEQIDEFVGSPAGSNFTFTYVGRTKSSFKNTTVVKPLYGKKLGDELGKYDVYVSGSRFDPGPNHITEALACGLPSFVHKDGGGCVEFAGQDASYDDWNDLKARLISRSFPVPKNPPNDWKTCVTEYVTFLENTCKTISNNT
jgi:hypothetical protein